MAHSTLIAAFSFVLVALSAPAGAQAPPRPLKFVDEGGIDKDWAVVQPQAQAPVPAGSAHEVCVALGYKINRDGRTSDVVVLKGLLDGAEAGQDARLAPYAQAAAAAVTQWRYEPKPGASSSRVMFTSVSVAFPREGGSSADDLRKPCVITGLKEFIAKAQTQNRTEANNADMEKLRNANREAALRATSGRFGGGN
jgi:hypothetical protein